MCEEFFVDCRPQKPKTAKKITTSPTPNKIYVNDLSWVSPDVKSPSQRIPIPITNMTAKKILSAVGKSSFLPI
jgi:hypothetical protein